MHNDGVDNMTKLFGNDLNITAPARVLTPRDAYAVPAAGAAVDEDVDLPRQRAVDHRLHALLTDVTLRRVHGEAVDLFQRQQTAVYVSGSV